MEYKKLTYDSNEKIVLNTGFGFFIGAIGLFILTVMIVDNYESLLGIIQILATIGIIGSMVMIVTGNIRVGRFLFVIRKLDSKAQIWKSVLTIFLSFISLVIYWFTLLIIVFESF